MRSFPPTGIRIGPHTLPNTVMLAPMSGVTDAPFRRLVAQLGAGLVVSEMTACAKLIEGVGPSGADLWFGYTQVSQWQVWNRSESSPFRNTDYEAELVYVAPVPQAWQPLPGGWRWTLLQAGLSHQSNGQTNGLSRSWNRVYLTTGVERGPWALHVSKHFRLPEVFAIQITILCVGLFQDYGIGVLRRLFLPYADLTLERR